MSKTVIFGRKPLRASPEAVDRWMAGSASNPSTPPPGRQAGETGPASSASAPPKMKRLTIDIPEELHRRVKGRCGQSGMKICDVIREMLENRFPAQG